MSQREALSEVRLSALAYTMNHWLEREGRGEMFDLDAPYQRGVVWTDEQKRSLIKSLLMGLPVGNIIVAKRPTGSAVYGRIVDGKQRITAIRDWAEGRLGVPAWWFDARDLTDPSMRDSDVFSALYTDLSERGRRTLWNRHMPALEFESTVEWLDPLPGSTEWRIHHRSEDEALKAEAELYLLINFGGVAQGDDDFARSTAIARS